MHVKNLTPLELARKSQEIANERALQSPTWPQDDHSPGEWALVQEVVNSVLDANVGHEYELWTTAQEASLKLREVRKFLLRHSAHYRHYVMYPAEFLQKQAERLLKDEKRRLAECSAREEAGNKADTIKRINERIRGYEKLQGALLTEAVDLN